VTLIACVFGACDILLGCFISFGFAFLFLRISFSFLFFVPFTAFVHPIQSLLFSEKEKGS